MEQAKQKSDELRAAEQRLDDLYPGLLVEEVSKVEYAVWFREIESFLRTASGEDYDAVCCYLGGHDYLPTDPKSVHMAAYTIIENAAFSVCHFYYDGSKLDRPRYLIGDVRGEVYTPGLADWADRKRKERAERYQSKIDLGGGFCPRSQWLLDEIHKLQDVMRRKKYTDPLGLKRPIMNTDRFLYRTIKGGGVQNYWEELSRVVSEGGDSIYDTVSWLLGEIDYDPADPDAVSVVTDLLLQKATAPLDSRFTVPPYYGGGWSLYKDVTSAVGGAPERVVSVSLARRERLRKLRRSKKNIPFIRYDYELMCKLSEIMHAPPYQEERVLVYGPPFDKLESQEQHSARMRVAEQKAKETQKKVAWSLVAFAFVALVVFAMGAGNTLEEALAGVVPMFAVPGGIAAICVGISKYSDYVTHN
ncbi:hypothetical protein [Pseudoflavonifractor sp. MSJ-37]|uniref:hypothetical protein n=1 Tax=Pseudoflavonifractor sp. MSJ-37 TaxID=2841531 RepID=UPI001C122272|nr:hypothetical protein [Pseudoflavonifractor sp. MSJ-37]MBU5434612.1 hypothetical protein [Pseudoflavonifractor sp. MSJ-37]